MSYKASDNQVFVTTSRGQDAANVDARIINAWLDQNCDGVSARFRAILFPSVFLIISIVLL